VKKTTFGERDLHAFGDTVLMTGAVYVGNGESLVVYFPGAEPEHELQHMEMSVADWEALLKQTDLIDVEATMRAEDGTLVKAMLRKSARAAEAAVSWKCFKRDGYACRYCANDDTVLTVDHLVTWETGGPWIMANLLTACKKCNRVRGRLSYAEWLRHSYYLAHSKKLTPEVRAANEALVATLAAIPLVKHIKSR
jgi:hypothetical protein